MTVDTIERLKDIVNEINAGRNKVVSCWEYTNVMNGKVMFAVFTESCVCDIFQSPAVKHPMLIYRSGHFIGKYKFMDNVVKGIDYGGYD